MERAQLLSFEEIARVTRIFTLLGVEKFRITGGEPLLRRQLERLITMLSDIPTLDLTLTTNGALLAEKARRVFTRTCFRTSQTPTPRRSSRSEAPHEQHDARDHHRPDQCPNPSIANARSIVRLPVHCRQWIR